MHHHLKVQDEHNKIANTSSNIHDVEYNLFNNNDRSYQPNENWGDPIANNRNIHSDYIFKISMVLNRTTVGTSANK